MLRNRGLNKVPSILAQELSFYDVGVSLNGGAPQNTLKWLCLVGKPIVPHVIFFSNVLESEPKKPIA